MKISFVKLGEECEVCDAHQHHLVDHHGENENELNEVRNSLLPKHENCISCQLYGEHVNKAISARNHYKEDGNKEVGQDEMILSVDLQKVMLLPRLPGVKKAIFCKRLVVFNESFVPIGNRNGKGIGILWHEGIDGRCASDVASSFIKVSNQSRFRDYKHITLWADNCSGQYKNWYLFSALIKEVNRRDINADTITIKHFEPGYAFMSADSFHALIEKGIRRKNKLQDFSDLVDIVNERGDAVEMSSDDFLSVKKNVSEGNFASNKPKLENVQVVRFNRDSTKLYWKVSFSEKEFHSTDWLQKKAEKQILCPFPCIGGPRGIKTLKKDNIVKTLLSHLEENRRKFWLEMQTNDISKDLSSERDPAEEEEQ